MMGPKMHTNVFRPTLIFWFVSFILLTGCQPEKDDLRAYVAEVKSQSQSDIPPIPVMKPYEKFEYAAEDLRDPFVPTVVDVPTSEIAGSLDNGISPDTNRRKEALEFFALSDLQFVGTLEQDTIWALIRAPDSVIHKVRTGNHIGSNYGQILAISDSELKLKEIVPEGNGYVERETSLSVVEIN